ncbi:MAG: MliC family protein [Lysobacter sp.]
MRVLTLPLLIACVTGACTVSTNGDSGAASDALPPSSANVTPATPPPVDPDATRYDCDDGRVVQVGYGDHDATLQMDGEPVITLPRAESASTAGVDVYVGRNVALQREGDSIQLELTGASLRCWPVAASQ